MAPLGRAWLLALVCAWALGAGGRAGAHASPSPPPPAAPEGSEEGDDARGETAPATGTPGDVGASDTTPPAPPEPGATPDPSSAPPADLGATPNNFDSPTPDGAEEDGAEEDGAEERDDDNEAPRAPGRPAGPRPPRPSKPPPRGRRWMLCDHEAMAAPYADPLYVNCGVADAAAAAGPARLELWFLRVGRFRSSRGDAESVRNPFPRAGPALLLAIENGTVAYRDRARGGAYLFPAPTDPRRLPLTIRSLTAATEGVYTWRRMTAAGAQLKTVTVTTHRPPDVAIAPRPTLRGAGHSAECRAAGYYPPRSTRLRWFRNGYPVDPQHARDEFEVSEAGLLSRTSVVTLEDAGADSHPPNLRCEVSWFQSLNMERRFAMAVLPAVYDPPELRVAFEGGEAVCEARCVPERNVTLRWAVRDGAAAAPAATALAGVCAERPGLVNLRSVRLLSGADGPVAYTCTAAGYPEPLPEFSVTETYDASPSAAAGPILIGVVGVVCALGAAGAVGLLVVACLRCARRPRL
uniref:Glycoprotein gC n=1 Tax=Caprine alphaherpesvirus 1 TaxID=39944 RepID=Q66044_9ALPH|nr:glycoprotein gC [Caprine alphaherpesvirus 1]